MERKVSAAVLRKVKDLSGELEGTVWLKPGEVRWCLQGLTMGVWAGPWGQI